MQILLGVVVGRSNMPLPPAGQMSVMYQNGAPSSLDFSIFRRPLLLPSPVSPVAISSCCVLNSPRGVRMYIALARKRNSWRLSSTTTGMHSQRLRGMQGPVSAMTIVAQCRPKNRMRQNNLGLKCSKSPRVLQSLLVK